jgi:hypothetical protein
MRAVPAVAPAGHSSHRRTAAELLSFTLALLVELVFPVRDDAPGGAAR